ncbi:MAG: DUF4405 domain-containing protein [Trueperaceae bacterium]
MVMIASFVVFTLTGLALFVAPSGQMAQTIDWRLLALSKGQWETVHVAFGFLWMPLAALHLAYNWRVVRSYVRDRSRRTFVWRREAVAALALSVLLAAAAVFELPPVTQLMQVEAAFGEVWARRAEGLVVLPSATGSVATPIGGAEPGSAPTGQGGGMGRYATIDPETGALQPVGKEAAARSDTTAVDEAD